ncbi:nitronate monooxygenase [Streptomyces sp. NBC_01478]|uniref:nitronate monooxygenase n=1 Tax=Streptomyces sp. NBC_01478 TaxID=2903882 RepID=UPI002E36DD32|nr:nitronate monooxygenase [Streptomyces sp. NBC_01478]
MTKGRGVCAAGLCTVWATTALAASDHGTAPQAVEQSRTVVQEAAKPKTGAEDRTKDQPSASEENRQLESAAPQLPLPQRAMMVAMALSTAFTKLFGVRHPVALAPMGGSAGGALTAAVSRGGGLGLLGSGNGERSWLARELAVVAENTTKPWGIGFLTWQIDVDAVEHALEHRPAAVMLSFGDPSPFAERIRRAGTPLIIQVTDLEEARRAVDLGADVIVAQGSESGGHGARHGRSTLPFVPVVVDLAAPVPVLAAGGIADGRGLAAALALGAAGALIGTRFQATTEALITPSTAAAIVEGHGGDTERNSILDIARGSRWPSKYTARTLGHPFLDA